MSKWCPSCKAEYVEGWGTCSRCGDALVDQPTTKRTRKQRRASFDPDDAIFIEPRAARNHEDPFSPVWEGPTTTGTGLARHLEKAHIPVDMSESNEPGRTRIEVPRSYMAEAIDILQELEAEQEFVTGSEPFDTDFGGEDPDGAYEPIGWPLGVRLALAAVAVVLIVALILLY